MICQCGADITDPVRRFGDPMQPVCWECYSRQVFEDEARRPERPTLDNPYMMPLTQPANRDILDAQERTDPAANRGAQ